MSQDKFATIQHALIEKRTVHARLKPRGAADWHISARFSRHSTRSDILKFYVINGAWDGELHTDNTIRVLGAEKKLYDVEIGDIRIETPKEEPKEVPF